MSDDRPPLPRPNPPKRPDHPLEVRQKVRGHRPGDRYVRIVRPYEELFGLGEGGELVATERTVLQRPG
jgi:hypothetical protein